MMRTKTAAPNNRTKLSAIAAGCRLLGVIFLGLTSMGSVANAQEAGNALQDIQIQSLPGRQVELRLTLSNTAPEPLSFTIDNPARIVLDIPDTSLAMDKRRQDVDLGPLATIMMAQANGRTRAVLNLDSMVSYQTRVSGNTIIVTLGESQTASTTTSFASKSAPAASGYGAQHSIDNIDFRRTREGGGRIIVNLTDPSTPVDIRQEGGRVIALFKNTSMPDELIRRLDVQDFATPVTTVDAMRVGSDVRLLINADGKYEQLAYQSDGQFAIEISPVSESEQTSAGIFDEEKEYEGERVTLNFQDIETRAVLQVLAEISGRNIVVSDTVGGSLTLRLKNVPWDQALDIVMTTRGLDMRENGNVIIVAPAEEIAAREKADLESRMQIQELEPIYSEFLQVNYATAADIARLVGSSSSGNALLSERGSVAIDERTNTLLIQDTADRLRDIRRMVAKLDIPIQQVLIESRIVSVNDDFSRELGVRLGLTAVEESGAGGLFSITGSSAGSNGIVSSALDNLSNTGQPFPVDVGTVDSRYNVNLPVPGAAGQFALAVLESDYIVDLELSALQAEGRGEIVSSPRVITANQAEATIEQGVEIGYQEASSSGATAIAFKKAVLSLTVTPQITPDGNIAMQLRVSQDTVGQVIAGIPSVDTRNVQTQVLVRDGQTVVLGGIYETERRDVVTKVPFLGDLPGVGRLFKTTQRVNNKSELLIFVTPKILDEGAVLSR